jgi:hypothetical protein
MTVITPTMTDVQPRVPLSQGLIVLVHTAFQSAEMGIFRSTKHVMMEILRTAMAVHLFASLNHPIAVPENRAVVRMTEVQIPVAHAGMMCAILIRNIPRALRIVSEFMN